jgi:hypothetical protein
MIERLFDLVKRSTRHATPKSVAIPRNRIRGSGVYTDT